MKGREVECGSIQGNEGESSVMLEQVTDNDQKRCKLGCTHGEERRYEHNMERSTERALKAHATGRVHNRGETWPVAGSKRLKP